MLSYIVLFAVHASWRPTSWKRSPVAEDAIVKRIELVRSYYDMAKPSTDLRRMAVHNLLVMGSERDLDTLVRAFKRYSAMRANDRSMKEYSFERGLKGDLLALCFDPSACYPEPFTVHGGELVLPPLLDFFTGMDRSFEEQVAFFRKTTRRRDLARFFAQDPLTRKKTRLGPSQKIPVALPGKA